MKPHAFIGIDAAADTFVVAVFESPTHIRSAPGPLPNTSAGIDALEEWLVAHGVTRDNAHVCIEQTGVYSETLCYQLHARGFRLTLLDPRSLSNAFGAGQPKTDALDARRIAEYGFRYWDTLRPWAPHAEVVEQIRVLLSTREQLVQQKTATQNTRTTLARKWVQTPAANQALDTLLAHLCEQITTLEAELKRLIRRHPTLLQGVSLLLTAPGVGWLLAAHFAVLTHGFTTVPVYRSLAQYLGVAPNPHTSGTSVRGRPRSRRYGPPTLRKLLHLAARSRRTHDAPTRAYFLEKTLGGKPPMLVLNNIVNKMLKQLCAMLTHQTSYLPGHRSLNPRLLALA